MTKKEEKKIVNKIRKMLPTFTCKKGCTSCCGSIMPMTKYEYDAIKEKKVALGVICPYITKTGCSIYTERPLICRMFGLVARMKCSHGCGSDVMLSDEQEFELLKQMAGLDLIFNDAMVSDCFDEHSFNLDEIHRRLCTLKTKEKET